MSRDRAGLADLADLADQESSSHDREGLADQWRLEHRAVLVDRWRRASLAGQEYRDVAAPRGRPMSA